MLVMEPPFPASTIALPNTWQARNTLVRSISRMRCHSASLISKKGVPEFTPAAFNRMSTWPAPHNRPERLFQAGLAGGVGAHADGSASQALDGARSRFRAVLADVQNGDLGSGLGQTRGHRPGEDSAASNHHRHLAGQRKQSVLRHTQMVSEPSVPTFVRRQNTHWWGMLQLANARLRARLFTASHINY